ncbi:hypothetical protein GQ600_15653 [Phytophthora cactorum]|nr:hypothetical protein GQ600_15653 [Phytophthora cactorum]
MIRRRKCIAEFFIRQAPSLPYDCATEMNIPAIPEEISTSTIDTADSTSTKKLHFVQVTWDIGESSLTVEQLEIENLGINDLGNRAIIAYADAAGAVAAERASMPALRVRRRNRDKILSTSTSALSATKLANEFERAVLQLHKQILDMVAECLIFAGLRHGEVSGNSMGTTNAEFLDFLEAQSKTQVKILEVEVRAGQELLRLHKTQYEKERVELEEEMTTLRVGRTETERLCAELRTDLRKCRSELACHVANATDIQRQKSVLEEKLASSEDKLHAKEVALLKLQAEYDKMHRVAAEAQMRVEKLKQSDIEESKGFCNQVDHRAALPEASKVLTSARDLPHTPKLFSKLSKQSTDRIVEEELVPQAEAKIDTSTNSSRSSNVAALEAMKQQMARDIQEQIAATRENPAAKSTQCADSFSSNAALQSPFGSQQLAQYHRPAQSVLYKKWTADRSRKMAQLANYRDQQAVLRAQQSMQTFQQALAQVREKR